MSYRPPKDLDEQARQARAKLTAHRGMATWGEKLVPIGDFRKAAAETRAGALPRRAGGGGALPHGRARRSDPGRGSLRAHRRLRRRLQQPLRARSSCWRTRPAGAPRRSTAWATWAASVRIPEKVRPLLAQGGVLAIQGNYEESLAAGREDCNCGYTDPRDNHFAGISYGYTRAQLLARVQGLDGRAPPPPPGAGRRTASCCSSTARRAGSTSSSSRAPRRCRSWRCCSTRTGATASSPPTPGCTGTAASPRGGDVVNVGVIGRPANDGNTHVWYAMLEARDEGLGVELVPLPYDHSGSPPRCAPRGCRRSSSRPS